MSKYHPNIDLEKLVALDVHTHAHVPTRSPRDPCVLLLEEGMAAYFKTASQAISMC